MKIKLIKFWQLLTVFAIVLLFFSTGYSQKEQWYGSFTYSVSLPQGDTKEFTDEISWRGIGLDYRYVIDRAYSVGLFFGWNVFYERREGVSEVENGAIYGTSDRTMNIFPIMVNYHYYFGERKSIRPYVGINAGGYIVNQQFAIGIFLWEDDGWQWAVAPEAGVVIPVERDFGLIVNGKYNYAFTGETVFGEDMNNAFWQINVGVVWEP